MLETLQMPDMLERVVAGLSPKKNEQAKALDAGIRGFLQHISAKGSEPPAQRRRQNPGEDAEMLGARWLEPS